MNDAVTLQTAPLRSPRTSIILAEVVRRQQEARRQEARRRARRPSLLRMISQFFDSAPFETIALGKRPELFLTGAGLVVRS
jgi:hypothetical protein